MVGVCQRAASYIIGRREGGIGKVAHANNDLCCSLPSLVNQTFHIHFYIWTVEFLHWDSGAKGLGTHTFLCLERMQLMFAHMNFVSKLTPAENHKEAASLLAPK